MEAAIDLVVGPIFCRRLVAPTRVRADEVERQLELALRAVAPRREPADVH